MISMIADPPTSGTRLGVGFDASNARTRNEAWKNAIGTKQVPARFALLPDGEKRWDTSFDSYVFRGHAYLFPGAPELPEIFRRSFADASYGSARCASASTSTASEG
jgi:hypothetical protein